MNIPFYYFVLAILIPRVFTQWKDTSTVTIGGQIKIFIAETILLLPLFSCKTYLFLLPFLLLYHTFQFFLHSNGQRVLPKRIVELFFLILTGGFLFGVFLNKTGFNSSVLTTIKMVINHHALFPPMSGHTAKRAIIYLLGILLLINEINNIIRHILDIIKTGPSPDTTEKSRADTIELNRGKVIGVIERILFFFFVITGNYASIAFILTAKGITRFKELDNKNFAEYVLIGTLLSSGLAILWALLIKMMLKTLT